MNISDQQIIITGAGGSIGSFLVADLLKDADRVIAVDRDLDSLKQLKQQHPEIDIYASDLTDAEGVESFVSEIYELSKPSVLINNAGLIHSEPLINLLNKGNNKHSFENWDKTIQANLYTNFVCSSAVAEQMVKRKIKGLIIGMSSVAASGNVGQTAYAAAKAGIEAMTSTWSKELGMFGIRTAAVAPGFFDTPSTQNALSEANVRKWTKAVPLGRFGKVDELSSAIRFIIENDYYNGKTLELNGGLSI